jgi:hypothetical protein
MSVAASSIVAILIVSMASGAISSSLAFPYQPDIKSAANDENHQTENMVASFGEQKDKEMSQLGQQVSKSNEQNNETTTIKISQMENSLADLSFRIEKLETSNSNLKSKLESMRSKYAEIKSQYSQLKKEYSRTLENNSQLEEDIAYYEERLALQNNGATVLQNKLSDSLSPPYTFIKDREIYWIFSDSQGSKYTWSIPIDTYREIIGRTDPQDEKVLHSEDGLEYKVRDHTKFIDSSSFSPWINEVRSNVANKNNETGAGARDIDAKFVYETWYIVSELTTYSPDIGEDPRWPLETLVEGGGDCEDFAILMASMLKASPNTANWKIQMVYFDSDHPQNPQNVNHVSLFIKTDEFEGYIDRSLDPSSAETWNNINGWYFDL